MLPNHEIWHHCMWTAYFLTLKPWFLTTTQRR